MRGYLSCRNCSRESSCLRCFGGCSWACFGRPRRVGTRPLGGARQRARRARRPVLAVCHHARLNSSCISACRAMSGESRTVFGPATSRRRSIIHHLPCLELSTGGSVVAEVVNGDTRGAHRERVEWFGLDYLQVVELSYADCEVGEVVARADLGRHVPSTHFTMVWLISSPGSVTNAAAMPPDST
jgi:hypothetical protein